MEDLEASGVDVFPVITAESTLMRLEYPTGNLDERVLSVAATAGSFTVEHVRRAAARSYLISASFRGEVPNEVVRELHATNAAIALDVQGFIRIRQPDGRLEHAPWPDAHDVLSLVDILKADAVEAESLTGEGDIRVAARVLAEHGPREVLITHREGLLVLADGEYSTARFHPKRIVGRSGRGDTCLGSYTAARLGVPPAEAIVWAAAVTSLKMESDGPFQRDMSAVTDLIQQKYGRTLALPVPVRATTRVHNSGT